MFTNFCWFLLTTLALFVCVNGDCWFCSKTRGGKEVCYGPLRPLSAALARAAGVPPDVLTCLRHWRAVEKNDNRCSSPLCETHSKKLSEIPQRLYQFLDGRAQNKDYVPGTKWCYKCKAHYYKLTETNSEMDQPKRRKQKPNACSSNHTVLQHVPDQVMDSYTQEKQKCIHLENELNTMRKKLSELEETTTEKQVARFQVALYRHQQTNTVNKLYRPEEMKNFSDMHSPGLYQQILNCISSEKTSENRKQLQQQRAVSLMHILAYFRSQKTSSLQKDSGLYTASSGLSLRGLSAGQTLGFSTTPRNVQHLKANLNKEHGNYISQQLQRANELTCFMILMIDDFHNIHTRHTPANLLPNNVVHMASCLADVHPSIRAVPQTTSANLHREVRVNINGQQRICRGGIDKGAISVALKNALVHMQHQFLDQLPAQMKDLDPGKLQSALRELRVYSDPLQDDLETLTTCMLIDEFEQDLKSMQNYKEALMHILNKYPKLELYSKQFVLPLPADWPGWYYPKKLIASGWKPDINIIPEQGPFHVCLNAYEDVVANFKFFFDKLYAAVFGGVLANKPKPFRTSICVTAALLGWQLIRSKVVDKFGMCKKPEFVTILHLLDHVVPLVFYQYNIFRSGDLKLYEKVMGEFAILFICWKRRHYDKSTLSFLSDCAYQCQHLPEYWRRKSEILKLITEKKVEVWHSVLRRNTEKHNTAKEIEQTAKALATSGYLSDFIQNFVPQFFAGKSEPNLWLIAGKTAEFLLDLFRDISQKCQNSQQTERTYTRTGNPKGKPTYYLPTFDTTVDSKCFPLSYNLDDVQPGLEPDPSTFCDHPTCSKTDISTVKRIACFHSFHQECMPLDGSCPICFSPLKKKAEKLADTFNSGLIKDQEQNAGELSPDEDDEEEETNTNLAGMTPADAEIYYKSSAWSEKVDNIVNSFATIPLPSKPNHSGANTTVGSSSNSSPSSGHTNSSPSSRHTDSSPSSGHTLTPIIVPPTTDGNVTYWCFPASISQSTVLGRMGSNACTFIALLFSKLFFSDNVEIPNINAPLTQTWVYQVVVQGILLGNGVYDSITRNFPSTYGVSQAAALMKNIIGQVSVGPELPASINQEANPAASLPFYFNSAFNQGKTTSLYILGGNTVVFVPTARGILLLDSHLHGNVGAVIAFAEWQHVFELLSWFQRVNNFRYTLGTVTNVTFP